MSVFLEYNRLPRIENGPFGSDLWACRTDWKYEDKSRREKRLIWDEFGSKKKKLLFTHKTVEFLRNHKCGRINAFVADDDKVHLYPYNGCCKIRIKDVLDEIYRLHLRFVYVYSNPFWNKNAFH